MKILNLYRILSAAHLTWCIQNVPEAFSQRGGIMLVGPPEQLKSTFVGALGNYGDCLKLSDLNMKQVTAYIRDELASGKYRTLALTSYEKLYKRNLDTSSNLEGVIMALMEEGFGRSATEDSRMFVRTAKCMVVGALVLDEYRRLYSGWLSSGFARRWLWVHFQLANPNLLLDAIVDWKPVSAGNGMPVLPYGQIPWIVEQDELRELRKFLNDQPGKTTPLILLSKIYCVLKWHYRESKVKSYDVVAWSVIEDFAESLRVHSGGAELDL
jgi:hypothetical protein